MSNRKVFSAVGVAAVVAACAAVGGLMSAPAGARDAAVMRAQEGAFTVDPVHSTIVFGVGHLGVAKFYGIIAAPTGEYLIDPGNLAGSFVRVQAEAEKIMSGNDRRDAHLKNPDFFNSKQFPTVSFESTAVKAGSGDAVVVEGNLTMLGVTKPVTASLKWIGQGETRQGFKSGFEAEFTIKRSDFGMTKFLEGNSIGDEVRLIVAVEGVRG